MNRQAITSERAFELAQVCTANDLDPVTLRTLAEEGVIELYSDPGGHEWMAESSVERVEIYQRLRRTLDVNHEGAEFAVLLLAELRELRMRLQLLESRAA